MNETEGKKLIERRHAEWRQRQMRWRFLLDSLEGGDTYRRASYGTDSRGWPIRNLIRHPREYPSPGSSNASRITDVDAGTMGTFVTGRVTNDGSYSSQSDEPQGDDYWTRWWRTPAPSFVAEAVDFHLSRIYSQEPRRDGPPAYLAWMEDVDGAGLSLKRWMREEVAPRLLVLGCVDVLIDRPPLPEGEELPEVTTLADRERLGLDRVEAKLIEPQDVLDWSLDRSRQYLWVLNRELHAVDSDKGTQFEPRYRRWDREGWELYGPDGMLLDSGEHGLGFVPQRRLMTRLQPRTTHCGVSLFEATAELQREYYNRDSELVLDDANHAHPQLQGDASAIEDGTVSIGPGWMLPIHKDASGNHIPYSVLEFPHGGAESLRQNKAGIREVSDRLNGLSAPAGANGAGTVSQSGVSKSFDDRRANDLLSRRADILADAELHIARLVVAVASDGNPSPADLDAIEISYVKQFDLLDSAEIGARWAEMMEVLASGKNTPEAALLAYGTMLREVFAGLPDEAYAEYEAEAKAYLEAPPEAEGEMPDFEPGAEDGVFDEGDDEDDPDARIDSSADDDDDLADFDLEDGDDEGDD